MGCMNSKSMSIRQDLNNRSHKTSAAFEELLTSQSGKNKLFTAFVQTTTINSASIKTSDFQSSEEPEKAANSIDLIQEQMDLAREPLTRSKSCNISREAELDNGNELDSNYENKKNLMMGLGSRSFHTVEELDALLERIHRSKKESSKEYKSFLSKDQSERSCVVETNAKEDPKNLEVSGSLRNWVKIEDAVRENGWKRKAVAERIKSLDVSTLEFPVIERVKQLKPWHELDYYHQDTPKFGEYNNNKRTRGEYGEMPCEFCPELLAAFEDCMREIQEEEESVLSDMENLVIEEVPVII